MKELLVCLGLCCGLSLVAQEQKEVEVQATMEEFIESNHLEDIEDIVHHFTGSKKFLNFLLEEGHDLDPEAVDFKRKDVRIGEDLDIYVKHITEHQNFTMLMVPVDFYNLAIYDTLLFAVLELSDEYLERKYFSNDLTDPQERARIMQIENHDLLKEHLFQQALKVTEDKKFTEIQVDLHESYISSSDLTLELSELTKDEKKSFRHSWSLVEKAFSHTVHLNIEMNIYIFGHDDMDITYEIDRKKYKYRITPGNIFTRHHFLEEN
ncbi:MAG: hypothetical protein JXQ90_14680 [Cyclobacteriaceae bacterium]